MEKKASLNGNDTVFHGKAHRVEDVANEELEELLCHAPLVKPLLWGSPGDEGHLPNMPERFKFLPAKKLHLDGIHSIDLVVGEAQEIWPQKAINWIMLPCSCFSRSPLPDKKQEFQQYQHPSRRCSSSGVQERTQCDRSQGSCNSSLRKLQDKGRTQHWFFKREKLHP